MANRFQDLEYLLFKGFIPLKIKINDLNIVLKTVNENEYLNIKLMSGLEDDPRYTAYFNLNYLFYSIYMVDGMNVLKDRDSFYSSFIDILNQFPSAFFRHILKVHEDLLKRQNRCINLIEQYFYENESRYNWEYRKNSPLHLPHQTATLGTDLLGINQFQKYWIALNVREDNRIKFQENYGLAKFLASFQDPKAVRKIEQQDKVKEEEDQKRKERLRVMGTEEELKYLSDPTDTREGIVKALEKQMRGEKDDHDLIIEEYEKKLRMDMLSRVNDIKKVRDKRREELEDSDEEVKSISKDEMLERLERVKKRRSEMDNLMDFDGNSSSKFYQMSNVKDDDILREEDFMSDEDYQKLMEDSEYQKIIGSSNTQDRKKIEEEYKRQQKIMASKYGLEDDFNFPNIKG